MTFDELIAQGIRDTLEERCAEYYPVGKKHHFSLAYKIGRLYIIYFRTKGKPLSFRSIKIIFNTAAAGLAALLGLELLKVFLKGESK